MLRVPVGHSKSSPPIRHDNALTAGKVFQSLGSDKPDDLRACGQAILDVVWNLAGDDTTDAEDAVRPLLTRLEGMPKTSRTWFSKQCAPRQEVN